MDHHENIYIKMMVDKAYKNKTSRKTESKKIDQKKKKNSSHPFTHKSADPKLKQKQKQIMWQAEKIKTRKDY